MYITKKRLALALLVDLITVAAVLLIIKYFLCNC